MSCVLHRLPQLLTPPTQDLKSLSALIDTEEISIRDLRSKVEGDRNDTNTMFEIGVNWQQGSDNSHLRSFPLKYVVSFFFFSFSSFLPTDVELT